MDEANCIFDNGKDCKLSEAIAKKDMRIPEDIPGAMSAEDFMDYFKYRTVEGEIERLKGMRQYYNNLYGGFTKSENAFLEAVAKELVTRKDTVLTDIK